MVVDSLHDLIFPSNSCSVIAYGSKSNSVAALHVSRRALHCGMESIVSIWLCPCKISLHVGVSAVQLM